MAERNAAIRLCGKDGVKEWKKEAVYGKRSYIEGFFSRLKQIFGFSFRNRSEVNREKELLIKCYLYQIPLLIEQIRNITNSFNSSAGNTDNKITQNICK